MEQICPSHFPGIYHFIFSIITTIAVANTLRMWMPNSRGTRLLTSRTQKSTDWIGKRRKEERWLLSFQWFIEPCTYVRWRHVHYLDSQFRFGKENNDKKVSFFRFLRSIEPRIRKHGRCVRHLDSPYRLQIDHHVSLTWMWWPLRNGEKNIPSEMPRFSNSMKKPKTSVAWFGWLKEGRKENP